MKKLTFLLGILLLCFGRHSTLLAQNEGFQAGLRAGINAAQVNGDNMGGFHKLGFVGGLFVNYPFSEKWSAGFEMLYSQKGSSSFYDNGVFMTGIWDRLTLHYIEVPLLATYHFNDKFNFQGGLGAAYLFGFKISDPSGAYSNNDFKKYEINATLGASYRFADQWALFARYTNTIVPISKDNKIGGLVRGYGGMYNIVASFGLFYYLRNS